MKLYSDYYGHTISPNYNFNIKGWNYSGLNIENNSVNANVTYLLDNGSTSYVDNINIPLDDSQRTFYPVVRPGSDQSVKKLTDVVQATFINNSTKNFTGDFTIRHEYGNNSDDFKYEVTVTPPPPVCTTSLSSPVIDLGTFTISKLQSASVGQKLSSNGSVKVFSQCTNSASINVALRTSKVNSDGCLSAGGGIEFCPYINSTDVKFNESGAYYFTLGTASYSFELGVNAVRSGEKASAGNYKNIMTITTTAN
ncbi:hypothetical protein ACTUSX_21165 [Pantoea ananatis]|uniref:hypothetical protein n=1 Tax=Pantoea ananas TaxID=553 RepID=UPI003FA46919